MDPTLNSIFTYFSLNTKFNLEYMTYLTIVQEINVTSIDLSSIYVFVFSQTYLFFLFCF